MGYWACMQTLPLTSVNPRLNNSKTPNFYRFSVFAFSINATNLKFFFFRKNALQLTIFIKARILSRNNSGFENFLHISISKKLQQFDTTLGNL